MLHAASMQVKRSCGRLGLACQSGVRKLHALFINQDTRMQCRSFQSSDRHLAWPDSGQECASDDGALSLDGRDCRSRGLDSLELS
jgi:hypothetical protein